ncbi:MAG: hypothetical protein P9X27_06060 [Candidatus Kaelpia aquatica]|nr:hypothetical protein [Candidatus Kaelpia aquatica]
MRIFLTFVLLFFAAGCRSLFQNNYLFKIQQEEFFLQGSVLVKGWGIADSCFKNISFEIPGEPYKAFLYYAGRNSGFLEDKSLYIEGQIISGRLIYAENVNRDPAYNRYVYTLRYDITPFVKRGENNLEIWGFESFLNEGLGVVILYEDSSERLKRVVLKSGLGFFWSGLEDEERRDSPMVEFKIKPNEISEEARVFMFFAGGSESPRDERVWFKGSLVKLNSSIISDSELLFENQIASYDGGDWDSLDFKLPLKKEDKFIYFQIESLDFTASEHNGDSLNFVLTGLEIPLVRE